MNIYIFFTALLFVQLHLINIYDSFRSNYVYIFPLPPHGLGRAFLLVSYLLIIIAVYYCSTKHSSIANTFKKYLSLLYTIITAVSLAFHIFCIGTGIYRINNIETERFPIQKINLSELQEYESTYSPENPIVIREIIMVSKAGCPYCEDVYLEVEKITNNFPVSIKYYDCYMDSNNNRTNLDDFLDNYSISYVPCFILYDYESWTVIPYSENMTFNLIEHINSMANQNFYYTSY